MLTPATPRTFWQRYNDAQRLKLWHIAARNLLIAQKVDDGTHASAQAIAKAERYLERVEAAMQNAGQPLPSWSTL